MDLEKSQQVKPCIINWVVLYQLTSILAEYAICDIFAKLGA